jgi:hypothetical protein
MRIDLPLPVNGHESDAAAVTPPLRSSARNRFLFVRQPYNRAGKRAIQLYVFHIYFRRR